MKLCVPVVFNEETLKKEFQSHPKMNVPKLPVPWPLIALRIVLMIVSFTFLCRDSSSDSRGTLVLRVYSVMFDWSFLFPLCNRKVVDYKDYALNAISATSLFGIRTALAVGVIIGNVVYETFSFGFTSATIGCIVIEVVVLIQYHLFYPSRIKNTQDAFVKHIQDLAGLDNCVSKAVRTKFYKSYLSRKVWEGVAPASRDTSIYVTGKSIKKKDGVVIDFVSWGTYALIRKVTNENMEKIKQLNEANEKLRCELHGRNLGIFQIRDMSGDPNVHRVDTSTIPFVPALLEPWIQDKAEGVYVLSSGIVEAYVELRAFRDLAIHHVSVKQVLAQFENERRELKGELNRRNKIVDEMLKKLSKETAKRKCECVCILMEDTS